MNIENMIKTIIGLPEQDFKYLRMVINSIDNKDNGNYNADAFTTELRETRFDEGKKCPKCQSKHIVRNGTYNGKQRYLCKNEHCGKSFSDFTSTPLSYSKKDIGKWGNYIRCMIDGFSIRKCAELCKISIPTAFYWRHKILDAIKQFVGRGDVDGIVEADETFFLESFKGNHKKNNQFKMPRNAHKRGGQARTRGISKEYVCVSTAIDRKGNIIVEMTNKGRVSSADLKRLYQDHIDEKSIICTDSHRSYDKLTTDLKLTHIKLKGGKIKEGIYHIQRVNSFHSKLKKWISRFNGVSTKHLSNYLGWFKWLEVFKEEKEKTKMRYLFLHSNQYYTNTKIENISKRIPNYI